MIPFRQEIGEQKASFKNKAKQRQQQEGKKTKKQESLGTKEKISNYELNKAKFNSKGKTTNQKHTKTGYTRKHWRDTGAKCWVATQEGDETNNGRWNELTNT